MSLFEALHTVSTLFLIYKLVWSYYTIGIKQKHINSLMSSIRELTLVLHNMQSELNIIKNKLK